MKKKFFIIYAVFVLIMSCDNHGNLKIIEEKNQEKTKEKDVKGQVQEFFEKEDKELMQADEPKKQISKEEQQKQNRKKALEDAKEKVEGFRVRIEVLKEKLDSLEDKEDEFDEFDLNYFAIQGLGHEACECAFKLGFNLEDLTNWNVYKGIETDKEIVSNVLKKIEEELKKL
ncbi:hypothetical protein QIA41_05300 (plasmid) [Borreliella sinica]|uniref:hypothetical protein n=1 Tax=Borreliella sinica TaxID=87162 RepID=UPI003AF05244